VRPNSGCAALDREAGVGRLDGQVAVVTGASSGIGRAIALALGAEGADVVVNYARSRARAQEVAEEIARGGRRAIAVGADVSRSGDVERLVAETLTAFGAIHIWVNNAGVDILTGEAATRPEEEKWDRVIAVDLKGTWLCSRAAAAVMTGGHPGAIVNISWDHALAGMGNPTAAIYAAAKGGVLALSRCLAREFAPRVRVNVVAPGWIRTAWGERVDEAVHQSVVQATPLARWGTAGDVASAVLFLASSEASFITGEMILVGGGVVMA
jgi:3-oxoacyl-[acyl-carrier protein] reductase